MIATNLFRQHTKIPIRIFCTVFCFIIVTAQVNARQGSDLLPEFRNVKFVYREINALGFEEGVTRRDPSDIIKVDSLYYVWYSRSVTTFSGYDATIWYATSPDGIHWTEKGQALQPGPAGSWDDQSVFTPNILIAGEKYYLFYTAVAKPFTERTKTAIGVAVADSPDGPWCKIDSNPILCTGKAGKWIGRTGTQAEPKGAWDSHRVDDACLIIRDGRYWLYYKGRQMGLTPAQTKMGVAIADKPTGPYIKYDKNPIVPTGHEVLVWPHRQGVAALISSGPPAIWYSRNGVDFFFQCQVTDRPNAPGAYRPDAFSDTNNGAGIKWGISMVHHRKWPYLIRFDCNLSANKITTH